MLNVLLIVAPIFIAIAVGYLLAYGAASLTVFAAGFTLNRLRGRDVQTGAIAALGMSVSNSGFIGFPLAALVVGVPAIGALALCMLVENLLIIPLALALAEMGARSDASLGAILRASAARLATNPLIIAIALGVTLSLTGLKPPAPILKVLEMFALASAPVALFVIGGSLVGLRGGGLAGQIAPIVAAKLLLHPAAVLLAFRLVPDVGPGLASAAFLMASVPMLSIYPLIGQRYGLQEMCSAALLAATIVSVASVSTVVWLIGG